MVLTRSRLLAAVTLVAVLSWLMPVLASEAPAMPKLAFKFENLGKWDTHTIDIDKNTLTSVIDKDGDTHVGAVFRIVMKSPAKFDGRKEISTFVNSVIAVCGYDTLVLVATYAYDPQGALVDYSTSAFPVQDMKQASTPPTEIYKHLCKDVKPKAPAAPEPPSYTRPRGNNYT